MCTGAEATHRSRSVGWDYEKHMKTYKREFNLLGGVNQGSGVLLARGLEKGQPVPLVNTLEKIECYLAIF